MKKTIFIILTMMSILTFSKANNAELKGTTHVGYDILTEHTVLMGELTLYRKFESKKTNAIFNIGGGIDVAAYLGPYKQRDKYAFILRPYFSTEIGGYVNKDTRMYTDIKLGIGFANTENTIGPLPKFGLGLGLVYKENFTAEIAYNFPVAVTLGIGARFGF